MATSFLAQSPTNSMEQLDAARTLLDVSPASSLNRTKSTLASSIIDDSQPPLDSKTARPCHGFSTSGSWEKAFTTKVDNSVRSNASALDALAALASDAHSLNIVSASGSNSPVTSSDDDSDAMPPPPPRRKGRMRSASNPEGMEKWDSYCHPNARRHFVLPTSILEKELASANSACEAHDAQRHKTYFSTSISSGPLKKRGMAIQNIAEEVKKEDDDDMYGSSPTSVTSSMLEVKKESIGNKGRSVVNKNVQGGESPPEDDATLEPAELLKRARSRLLEDLSTETGLEKGVLPLPHSLDKYKEIYNKNGRIGIYTPAERAAIIAKFNSKRSRRVWNKKIRYNCRKNLADRRMRVKGRFVKRSVEQCSIPLQKTNEKDIPEISNFSMETALNFSPSDNGNSSSGTESPIPSALQPGPLAPVKEDSEDDTVNESSDGDVDMPDVNDPEAGFKPTASQPYRRVRRHTIT